MASGLNQTGVPSIPSHDSLGPLNPTFPGGSAGVSGPSPDSSGDVMSIGGRAPAEGNGPGMGIQQSSGGSDGAPGGTPAASKDRRGFSYGEVPSK